MNPNSCHTRLWRFPRYNKLKKCLNYWSNSMSHSSACTSCPIKLEHKLRGKKIHAELFCWLIVSSQREMSKEAQFPSATNTNRIHVDEWWVSRTNRVDCSNSTGPSNQRTTKVPDLETRVNWCVCVWERMRRRERERKKSSEWKERQEKTWDEIEEGRGRG